MNRTMYESFRAAYTTVRSLQKRVWHLRHRMASWPRMGLPTTAVTLVPRLACAAQGWGYRRTGMDIRSDRDIDSVFFIRNRS
jgi:hypothetical protein